MSLPTGRIIGAALAAAACALVPAAASAGVVVAASGPSAGSYPVGKKIGDSERIVLRAGDSLTVLDGNGTRVLRGAGTFSLDQQAGPSRRSTFAVLTQRRSAARVRTGAVRTDETGPALPTSLWYVDIERPGRTCLAETERVRLWRASPEGDAIYTVRTAGGGGGQTVEFPDGGVLAPWDAVALPVAAGSEYSVSGPNGAVEGALSFVVLDAVPEEPEALAAQLIENGCTRQLELLSTATLIAEG